MTIFLLNTILEFVSYYQAGTGPQWSSSAYLILVRGIMSCRYRFSPRLGLGVAIQAKGLLFRLVLDACKIHPGLSTAAREICRQVITFVTMHLRPALLFSTAACLILHWRRVVTQTYQASTWPKPQNLRAFTSGILKWTTS
jgi:hypothetical protein